MGDTIQEIHDAIETAQRMLPIARQVAAMIPGAGAPVSAGLAVAATLAPLIDRILHAIMAAQGKDLSGAVQEFVDHITPDAPNSPVLGG